MTYTLYLFQNQKWGSTGGGGKRDPLFLNRQLYKKVCCRLSKSKNHPSVSAVYAAFAQPWNVTQFEIIF